MAPINMINIPRPGSDLSTALSFQRGPPAKRKAEATSCDKFNTTAKRQKTASYRPNPRAPAKTPRAAKAPRRPRASSAAIADTPVATDATPTPAPAATAARTSSSDSNTTAAAQSSTRQSSAASQTSSQVEAPRDSLSPPAYRPDACFTQAVPAPITPWAHNFPAPTPRFPRSLASCPVDWSKVAGLSADHIEAYELRAPWDPAPTAFNIVATQTRFLNGKGEQPVEEAVRKRFKKANAAIFERTGVYFYDSPQGLADWHVRKPKKPKKERSSRRTPTGTTAQTPIAQDIRWLHGYGEAAVYQGEVVAVQLQAPSDSRPCVRICDAKLIPAYDELITHEDMLGEDDKPYVEAIAPFLPFSAKAFDHWHSSVCLGRAHEFPKCTLICKQIDEDRYMLRVNSRAKKASAVLMLETYVVSQAMGTTKTSGMILEELKKTLNSPLPPALDDDEVRFLQYLPSNDPVREIVNRFRFRTTGSSPGSECASRTHL
ncbi:hypothetical protein E8E12_001704 [Didymella heteroderae]|uniref:Uncharacterized protein n=1 Tax=Didymella heteroderae TaxID=1769908 RepID=A0A9P4WJ70_9PLEO|nr:hypothetical protein E8E12_001704 [Didymella heteroderae]